MCFAYIFLKLRLISDIKYVSQYRVRQKALPSISEMHQILGNWQSICSMNMTKGTSFGENILGPGGKIQFIFTFLSDAS